jgi:hypothetical protein
MRFVPAHRLLESALSSAREAGMLRRLWSYFRGREAALSVNGKRRADLTPEASSLLA